MLHIFRGVNLSRDGAFVGSLVNLKSLSMCHCSLSTLEPIQGRFIFTHPSLYSSQS